MGKVIASKKFTIDGEALTFAAGFKSGSPVVVFGVRLAGGVFDVATLEIPFPTINAAKDYTDSATEEIAIERRGELVESPDFLKILSVFSSTDKKVTREDLKEKIRRSK